LVELRDFRAVDFPNPPVEGTFFAGKSSNSKLITLFNPSN
jgi:hypothetical protein